MAISFDNRDFLRMQEEEQRRKNLELANSNLANAQNAYNSASSKPQGTILDSLGSVLGGIAANAKNVGDTLGNMAGTGAASIRDLLTGNAGTKKYQNEWKEYAKKNIYGDDNLSDKDYYAKTGGKALDAAATVSDFIPGVGAAGKAVLNVGQGAVSGIAQNYIDNGANVSLQDNLRGGLVGAASAGVGQAVGGKLAGANGAKSALGKALQSNVGKAAITGAAAGAVGGGLANALSQDMSNFNLGSVLGSAAQGAKGGALGGATMAGTMGLANAGIQKIGNKLDAKFGGNNGVSNIAEETPNTIAKQQVEAPEIATKPIESNKQYDQNLSQKKIMELEYKRDSARQKQGEALLSQYNSLDKPTRRAVSDPEGVLVNLANNYGLETPAELNYASKHVTGADGEVTKMTRELARSAKNVDASITGEQLNQWITDNGLDDTQAKAVTKQVQAALKRTESGNFDGETVLDVMKQLEKRKADYLGKNGTHHNATSDDSRKANVLQMVHDELQDRLWDSTDDVTNIVTPERIQKLKSIYPDNEKWQNFVDSRLASAKTGQELRSAMKPLVDGGKIVAGSKMSAGSSGDKFIKAATSANPIGQAMQIGATKVLDSDIAKRANARRYAKQAESADAQLYGKSAPKNNGGVKLTGELANIAADAKNLVSKPVNGIKNTIGAMNTGANFGSDTVSALIGGVESGLARQAIREAGQSQAQQEMNRQEANQALMDLQNAQTVQQEQQSYLDQLLAQPAYDTVTDSPLYNQMNTIGNAMQLALNAGDLTSYAKLADMYEQASSIVAAQQKANSTSSTTTKLTGDQSKALTGLQQLETLASMNPTTKTALSSSPLAGLVNMTGGDEYANQAQALALTLGYLQSGANVSQQEAINIGKSYIPTAFDSEQVRQQKIARARQLLQNYLPQNG